MKALVQSGHLTILEPCFKSKAIKATEAFHFAQTTDDAGANQLPLLQRRGLAVRYPARPRMSFRTPAAVTAGPAPGPVTTSGFWR